MYRGFFINLASNPKRLASITQNLSEVGLLNAYERYPAVDGSTLGPEYVTKLDRGNLGLWLTHERLLSENRSSPVHLHILEDDALLPVDAAHCLNDMLDRAESKFKSWDLIFTEAFLPPEISYFKPILGYKQSHQERGEVGFVPLHGLSFAGTSSLFVNKDSIDKYLSLIVGRWTKGLPIDMGLRYLIQKRQLDAYLTVPFLTTLSPTATESTIQVPGDVSREIMNIFRRYAYKDADLAALTRELRGLVGDPELSDDARMLLDVVKFRLSKQCVDF